MAVTGASEERTVGAVGELVVEDRERGTFRVHRRSFSDPGILALERERIFERCWIYVGHESEVPERGDFRSRTVAGRPVILVRGSDGAVRVLLNTCTHRGAEVCRERKGNAKSFQCFYHAWTFSNEGRLIGVPGKEAYPKDFDLSERGLGRPARVDAYRGFVFASFALDGEPLADFLAGAREYLDLVCDQSDAGMEIVGGTQEYEIRANWKLLVENSIDGYHAATTHIRYLQWLAGTGVDFGSALREGRTSRALDLGNGHAVIEYEAPWGRPIARWSPSFGEESKSRIEALRRRVEERFGVERAHRITQTSRNLLIYPNLIVNDIMAITVRTFFPVAPDRMEVSAWALSPRDESAADRARRLDNFLTFLGPGGFATPDDVEGLESCQRGFASRGVEWSDISKGMQRDRPAVDDELQMRVFWRQWSREIGGAPSLRPATSLRAVGG